MRTERKSDKSKGSDDFIEIPLPFPPPRVTSADLHANGKLFDDEVIAQIREQKADQLLKKDGKLIVCTKGKFFAIDPKFKLGSGSDMRSSSVDLAQDLETGAWVAIKSQNKTPINTPLVSMENQNLRRVGDFVDHVDLEGKSYTIMRLASGTDLDRLDDVKKPPQETMVYWLTVAGETAKCLSRLHNEFKLFHCDINPKNFKFDEVTERVTPVDLTSSREVAEQIPGDFQGVTGFLAPEALTDFDSLDIDEDNDEEKEVEFDEDDDEVVVSDEKQTSPSATKTAKYYSEKAEVYALGKVLANLFHLADEMQNIVSVTDDKFTNNTRIPNLALRTALRDFLLRMVATEPDKRPKLQDCIHFVNFHLYSLLKVPSFQTGIINVSELLDEKKQASLLGGLKNFSKVVLMDTSMHGVSEADKLKCREILKKQHIAVNNTLFHSPQADPVDFAAKISRHMTKTKPDEMRHFYLLSTEKLQTPDPEAGLGVIHVTPEKTETQYQQEMLYHLQHTVSAYHRNTVISLIKSEIQRLDRTYPAPIQNAFIRERVEQRKMALQNAITSVSQTASYQTLYQQLENLQAAMQTTSRIADKFSRLFTPKVTGKRHLRELEEHIKQDVASLANKM